MSVIGGISSSMVQDSTVIHAGRKWTVSLPSEAPDFSSTALKKAKARIAGPEDWSGTVEAYGHTPAIKPGVGFTFHGSMDGVNGVSGAVMCSSVAIMLNHESGEPIGHTISFEGNGAATFGAEAGLPDNTVQAPISPMDCVVKITPAEDASHTEQTIADVRSADIGINRELFAYTSSSTAKQKKRIAGVWDAEASVSMYVTDPALFPTPGAMYTLKIYVSATTFWEIKWALLLEISGVDVDRETGAIIGAAFRFGFSAVTMYGAPPGSATLGEINAPGDVNWWGD